jgi:ribosome biogenesis GTPase
VSRKPQKVRISFRKNRQSRTRRRDWTRQYEQVDEQATDLASRESVQAKGELSRHRTVVVEDAQLGTPMVQAPPRDATWQEGRVLQVSGHVAIVQHGAGRPFACAISRVLRTIEIDGRSAVVAGDRVQFRLAEAANSGAEFGEPQGMIERVEPRRGVITRGYRGREHVIAANVDQAVVVVTPAEPPLKPNLLDRYLVAAGQGRIAAVVCLNKADLADLAAVQPLLGLYAQLGYPVVVTSATTGLGLARLRAVLRGRASVFVGQSGVGKSSLLNALQPGLGLRVAEVSQATLHGKHTTTTACLLAFEFGGWVVDTPGVRQLELWDLEPWEVEGYFVEFRPLVPYCRFPNCTHTHEQVCAVKDAVSRGVIDPGRYTRYCNLFIGDSAPAD